MWVSASFKDWFNIATSTVEALRIELATVKAERDLLKASLTTSNVMSDFLRMQVNQLQLERTGLMEKAYNIRVPTPEIMKRTPAMPTIPELGFEDIGDAEAKKQGLPVYGDLN